MAPIASKLAAGPNTGDVVSGGPKIPGNSKEILSTYLFNLLNTITRTGILSRSSKPMKSSAVIKFKKEIHDFLGYLEACQDYHNMIIPYKMDNCRGDLAARLLSISNGESLEKKGLLSADDKLRAANLRHWIEHGVVAKPVSVKKTHKIGPCADHPVFGINGIAHGLTMFEGSISLNPEYEHMKRPSNVYGHNGLMAGIYGTTTAGAYSIVVSKAYNDLNNDDGNVIWYAGSGSKDNRDPHKVPKRTKGTKALHKSMETHEPVRVLRSPSEIRDKIKISMYAPTVGLRYDGLYRVELVTTAINNYEGLYERFKLVRCENQPSLESLQSIPSPKQQKNFKKIPYGF